MPELRPDRIHEVQAPREMPLQQRLSPWVLMWNHAGLRKTLVLVSSTTSVAPRADSAARTFSRSDAVHARTGHAAT